MSDQLCLIKKFLLNIFWFILILIINVNNVNGQRNFNPKNYFHHFNNIRYQNGPITIAKHPLLGYGLRASKISRKFDTNIISRSIAKNSDTYFSLLSGNYFNNKLFTGFDEDERKGLIILNRLVKESFIVPGLSELTNQQRYGRKRTFREIPTYMGKVFRGLTNLTVAIGRTINSENGNGSLSRLITHRLVGVSESLMGWVERSVDDLPSIPRLDAQECMKRCICEAHNQPKKYGAVGLIIQLFFPPYLDADDATKVVSKYQLAARYGRGENANCAAQYDDCMVNVLDILQGAINMIF